MRQLEQEGLLEYRRNRGCSVKKFESEDASEVFFLRCMLECSSIHYREGAIGEAFLRQMERGLRDMEGAIAREDLSGFIEQDQVFHGAIARACGLERLYALWDSLTPVSIALFLTDRRESFVLKDQYLRHKKVLDVLREGREEESCRVVEEHYLKTTALFKR